MSVLGKPLDRIDGPAKVTGRAPFAAEWPIDKIAHAVFVPSTIARGRVRSIDISRAEKAPGVILVMSRRNAPEMKQTPVFDPAAEVPGAAATSADILQSDEIAWNGQPIALVVAETLEQARHAAELIEATYEEEKPRIELESEIPRAFVPENVIGEEPEVRVGAGEEPLRDAAAKVDQHYTTPAENHVPIEPHATIAHFEGDQLTVYDSSQFVFGVRQMLANKFSIPEKNIRVLSPFVGGGFGCKGLAWPHVALCVAAARATKRPVKLSLPRQHYFRAVGGRTPTRQRVALGAGKDGKLSTLVHTGVTATSTTNMFTEQFTFPARHLYGAPNILLRQEIVRLDMVPPTFMRAPGETPGTFALESALDELSYALELDPIELRLRNTPEKDPTKDLPYSIRHAREMYAMGAERFGWSKRQPKPRAMRDGQWQVGYGVAGAYYPVYMMPTKASVRLSDDGTVLAQTGAHEMGMGTVTAQTQNLAEMLGVPVEKVRVEIGDTRFPFAAVAGGSSQTVSISAALLAARDALTAKLLELAKKNSASPLKDATPADVEWRDGGLYSAKEKTSGEKFVEILKRGGEKSIEVLGDPKQSDVMKKFSLHSYGAVFCEVRVDEAIGRLRVARVTGVYDTGKILNAKTASSQFRGGIIMGLGMALMEETHFESRNGRIMNPNLAEYAIPVHADVPQIDVAFLDKPDPHTPMGAHGIGEIGITGVAAAVANAVYHATGKRIRDLPITPEKVLS